MSAPPLQLDFAGRRQPLTLAGTALLLLGAAGIAAAALTYQRLEAHRAGLELKLEHAALAAERVPLTDERLASLTADADRVAVELAAPWTDLLGELEVVSRDSAHEIAVLSVEPDREKHRVHITAESRDLPSALAYVKQLQGSRLLRYPMLDSHEVRPDVPERPVLFAMTAEWRGTP